MDNQTLQRLMIDDALGALEPDVRALLSAYAVAHPGDEAARTQWQELAGMARDAGLLTHDELVPPLPHRRLRAVRLWHAGRTTLALAAAILIGVAVGLHLPQQSASVGPQAVVVPVMLAPSPAPAVVLSPGDFWSSKRLLASAMAAKPELRSEFRASPSLRWPSLLLQPTGVQ